MSNRLQEVVADLAEKHSFSLDGSPKTLYLVNDQELTLVITILAVTKELEVAHYYHDRQSNTLFPAQSVLFWLTESDWEVTEWSFVTDLAIRGMDGQHNEAFTKLNRNANVLTKDMDWFLEQFALVIFEQWASVPHTASSEPPPWFPNHDSHLASSADIPY